MKPKLLWIQMWKYWLSSWYKNMIGLIEILFCCILMLLCFCPVGCLSLEKLSWDSQQGRDGATSGSNKLQFQSGQSFCYIMRKVWCHQIWTQTYLGFIVLILTYMLISYYITIEKHVGRICFYYLFTTNTLIWSTRLFGTMCRCLL